MDIHDLGRDVFFAVLGGLPLGHVVALAVRGRPRRSLAARFRHYEPLSWPQVFLGSMGMSLGSHLGWPPLVAGGCAVMVCGATTIMFASLPIFAQRGSDDSPNVL